MEIIAVTPCGYCQGVVKAINIAVKTVKENPDVDVTMLGMIVHNRYVVDACKAMGINYVENSAKTRLALLDEIKSGIVIFTAHGVSDAVYTKAHEKGLRIVDATCEYVFKTHRIVMEHVKKGDVLYIGKNKHPESEGITGLSKRVHLIENASDLDALPQLENVLITTQTTLSLLDVRDIISYCLKKYPDAEVYDEICSATRLRQQAVINLVDIDLLIVVGDEHSNNAKQLCMIGVHSGIKETVLITCLQDLKEETIKNKKRIAVTAGSSTPNILTNQVVSFLRQYATDHIWQMPAKLNNQLF